MESQSTIITFLAGIIIISLILLWPYLAQFFRIWIKAISSGVHVSLAHLLTMRFRGTPPALLVDAYIVLIKENVQIKLDEIEDMYIKNSNKIYCPDDLVKLVKAEKK